MTRNTNVRSIVVFVCIALWCADARGQQESSLRDPLVLEVSGTVIADGVPVVVGKTLSKQAILGLGKDSELKLFSDDGLISIRGKFDGNWTPTQPGVVNTFFSHVREALSSVIVFAQLGGSTLSAHDLWTFRIDISGTKCLRHGQPPRLLIDQSLLGRSAVIYDTVEEQHSIVRLDQGTMNWPSDLPIKLAPHPYEVTIDQTGYTVHWQFEEVAGASEDEILLRMGQLHCAEQILGFALSLPPVIDLRGNDN